MLSHDVNNLLAMSRNLKQMRATWGRVSKILTRQEVPVPVAGMFYQAVVTEVLLHGNKSWVPPLSLLKILE